MSKTTVVIVDDHGIVRQGLQTYLNLMDDITVVAEAGNGVEALAQVRRHTPDVVLMDLVMPEMDGIEATRQIRQLSPTTKVIVLSSFTDDEKVFSAIKAGAIGYLLKDISPEDLARAVRAVIRGKTQLHPDIAQKLMNQFIAPKDPNEAISEDLTPREIEVLRLLAQGMSNAELATALYISEKTVKTHISNILGKLNLNDRTQAAIYAYKHGLVESQ
ncbi:MAG: response regulator transcription factor [Spirochaetaceae bacterium]|nr:MAG: response regulator transcription factor [Spirochaetaceae bacterium]